MCGIVGYIGSKQAQNILLEGLARLEYRGYDSAGVAVMNRGRISIAKREGRLHCLESLLRGSPLAGCAGIGHTRWATHGEPSDANAHPHISQDGRIAVVHNGIIENHAALRRLLEEKGVTFLSQTDTEVIAHMLSLLWDGSMLSTLRRVTGMLEGSFALAVLCAAEPNALFCARRNSPLVIGLGRGEQFIASDIPALITHTRQIEVLGDGETAVLTSSCVTVYDIQGRTRPLQPMHVDWSIDAAEKGGYAHFMLKEIHEQPDALQRTLSAYTDEQRNLRNGAFPVTADQARRLTSMTIAACGTAWHAGMLGRCYLEILAHLPVWTDVASELRYRTPLMQQGDLLLAISQSGETADTLAALREASRQGADVMALTNAAGSSLAREAAGHVLHTCAGPEIAVASTKAYITQAEVLLLLAIDLGVKRGVLPHENAASLLKELSAMPPKAKSVLALEERIAGFARRQAKQEHIFYIGRGIDHALALEASLKLKEISYIMSEAYAAGELKHGTIALIEDGSLVCALMTQPHLADKTISNIREVKARGAQVLVVCTHALLDKAAPVADECWAVPDADPLLAPLLAIIPVQLLAYHMAVCRGCDVDKPRNLAKSVTVE